MLQSFYQMKGRSRDLTTKIQRLERLERNGVRWFKCKTSSLEEDGFQKQCIYKIPQRIREKNSKTYAFQIVFIGLYRHKVDNIF